MLPESVPVFGRCGSRYHLRCLLLSSSVKTPSSGLFLSQTLLELLL